MAALTMHPTVPNCHPIFLCAALAWRVLRKSVETVAEDSGAIDLGPRSVRPRSAISGPDLAGKTPQQPWQLPPT